MPVACCPVGLSFQRGKGAKGQRALFMRLILYPLQGKYPLGYIPAVFILSLNT